MLMKVENEFINFHHGWNLPFTNHSLDQGAVSHEGQTIESSWGISFIQDEFLPSMSAHAHACSLLCT
jgi:hypothetical protein